MPAPDAPDTFESPFTQGSAHLLQELESARDILARRLAADHHPIPDNELNYAIVSSLLQALFLKAGEECGFADPGTVAALAACDGIAGRMARACMDAGADPAVLYERGPGAGRPSPLPPDEPLRSFLTRLEAPGFPVPPARLSLEECAGILDRFLGTRVQAAEGSRVKRSGKSALLYTGSVDIPPQEIVQAVVRETLRPVPRVAGEPGPRDSRILDMACGAGLFLLAAYRTLSRHRGAGAIGSIFGTDIDPESVSAARFVLLLAFIEESRREGTGAPPPARIREAVAAISRSVRCGNALIAPDYFTGKPVFPFNAEERRRVNPLGWPEVFPEVVAEGGFDAVIGAPPPYRPFAVPSREEYFQTHYDTYAPSAGLYGYFIERGLSLLRPGGSMGILVPGSFLRAEPARPLRRLILTRRIAAIRGTGHTRVLPEGPVPVRFLLLANEPPSGKFSVSPAMGGTGPATDPAGLRAFMLDQRLLDDGGWKLEDTREEDLLAKILASGTPLDQYVLGEIRPGTVPLAGNRSIVDARTRSRLTGRAWWCRRYFVPLVCPADIRRWVPEKPGHFVIAVPDPRQLRKCRALAEYLGDPAPVPETGAGIGGPGELPMDRPHLPAAMRGPGIVFAKNQPRPVFCYDAAGTAALADSVASIPRSDLFLLAILNSSLGRFVIMRTCPPAGHGIDPGPADLEKFPVATPDFDKLAEKTRHGKLVALVAHIMELIRYLPQAKSDQERRLVTQEIDAAEVRIDALVCEQYNLTPEEIAVLGAIPG